MSKTLTHLNYPRFRPDQLTKNWKKVLSQKRLCGDAYELLACEYLEAQNYQLISRNFNRRVGEIDLIMQAPDNGPVVFVEVRYRANKNFGGALASVDARKQRKLVKTAKLWLQRNAESTTTARIDIIAMSPATEQTEDDQRWRDHELVWIENAIEDA